MAFPIFGKKPIPATPAKAPAKPAASTGSAVPPSKLAPSTAGKPVAKAPAAPVNPNDDADSLDFTRGDDLRVSRGADIELREEEHQVPAVVEQAAMLYSIEQADSACTSLEAALRDKSLNLGPFAPRAWGMLFELYQELHRQAEFEQLALEYSARFESSPPTWVDPAAGAASGSATAGTGGSAGRSSVSVSGTLNDKAQEAMQALLKLAETQSPVRLDVTRVVDVDDSGASLLLATLRKLKSAHKECRIGGADKFATLLAGKVAIGQATREPLWLLLLAMYQETGAHDAFEDLAVNYAVTFELSPPSWEPVKNQPEAKASPPVTLQPFLPDMAAGASLVCRLEGVITAANDGPFAAIRAQSDVTSEVVVDASQLQRMDFVAAVNLMNLATALAGAGKKLRLIKAKHLLTALWEVVGLSRVARIETRKY